MWASSPDIVGFRKWDIAAELYAWSRSCGQGRIWPLVTLASVAIQRPPPGAKRTSQRTLRWYLGRVFTRAPSSPHLASLSQSGHRTNPLNIHRLNSSCRLARYGVGPHLVCEIVGHAQGHDMTLGVYYHGMDDEDALAAIETIVI